MELLVDFAFSGSDIQYLKSLGFHSKFLDYLKTFSFNGDIYSVREGEIVFPNEPLVRVEGNIIECQLIESLLLNILNFETLIATKSFQVKQATRKQIFADFGLRRAQGFGAIHASRAACIGGAASTSNTLAGKLFDIPVTGTMAHSWIQSFPDELTAFKTYANQYPGNSTLLVDTYDTLKSGVPNAIKTALFLRQKGYGLKAIRLDSGDLASLSKKARKMLDEAGLHDVKIVASNQLNEHNIKWLVEESNAPIDAFGVGTELITGKPDAALDGVYKLSWIDNTPKMKFSENLEKTTLPGQKDLVRFSDKNGKFTADGIKLKDEKPSTVQKLFNPYGNDKLTKINPSEWELLIKKAYSGKKILFKKEKPSEIFAYLTKRFERLPSEHKRFSNPLPYNVGISNSLLGLRNKILGQY